MATQVPWGSGGVGGIPFPLSSLGVGDYLYTLRQGMQVQLPCSKCERGNEQWTMNERRCQWLQLMEFLSRTKY